MHIALKGDVRIRMLSPPATAAILDDVPAEAQLNDFRSNEAYDVTSSVAVFFIASGWARAEMRASTRRRQHDRRSRHERHRGKPRRRLPTRRAPQ